MKKYILGILLLSTTPLLSSACDICGCGVGNSYIGILPDFNNRIFGIRYRHNTMLTHVGLGGMSTYLTTQERYNIIEAWGGWNITDKIRVMASVPYSFNERTNQGVTNSKNGISDMTVAGFYQLVNKRKNVSEDKLLVQSLWIGAGVKFATGKYNPSDKNSGNDNANLFQLGTGSTDFTFNLMYDVRLQDAGININSAYKVNTANKYDYRYGNKFNISTQAYYKFRIKNKLLIAPNAGIQYETANRDIDRGLETSISGGTLLLGTVGVEASFGKFSIGANMQTPLSQNLANGIIKANNRAMVHVSFVL